MSIGRTGELLKKRRFWLWCLPLVLILSLSTYPVFSEDDEDFDLESALAEEDNLDSYESPEELDEMLDAGDEDEEVGEDEEDFAEAEDGAELPELEEETEEEEDAIAGLDDEEEEAAPAEVAESDSEDDGLDDLMADVEEDAPAVAATEGEGIVAENTEDDELLDDLASEDFEGPADEAVADAGAAAEPAADDSLERDLAEAADVRNIVTNLQFRMVGKNSRIIASFQSKPRFDEIKNANINQYIYVFPNTETPQRLQRAFDTTEFISPVALFTLLQNKGTDPPSSKLIVQLRESQPPTASISGNDLIVEFPPAQNVQLPVATLKDKPKSQLGGLYGSGADFKGKTIQRLEIKNSDIQDVLRLIAKTSGYNIVIGDEVKGSVGTLSLEDVPWDQAFALVLQTKKLGYIRQGNVLRVQSLDALKAEKEAALAAENSRIKVEPIKTILLPVSYAKAAELSARAKPFLTSRGSIDVDDRTNTIIVRDIGEVVDRVQKLMVALDTQPPRVSISAKIVEMLSSFSRKLGFSRLGFAGGATDGFNFDQQLASTINEVSRTNINAADFLNLQTTFEIGELDNKVRTLANPTVSAVNNKVANVNQAVSFLVPDVVVVGGVATSTFKQIQANLTLDVTPIVNSDGSIFMTVAVTNDIPRGSGSNLVIDSRSIRTEVLVQNGDTAVIGGIFQNTVNKAKQGIPFLMRIPILGFFFTTNQTVDEVKNEIVVFLTPKILNAEKAFKRNL